MARLLDWTILSKNPAVKLVLPEETKHTYDLFSVTNSECLIYGKRHGNNINLQWGDPARSDNIRFQRASGSKDPIEFEEPIALNIRHGGFLVHEMGRWGINLGWSRTPRFEWRVLGGKAGAAVEVGKAVGLFSIVEHDSLVYEPRDSRINLNWFKDSGKYQIFSDALRLGKIPLGVYREVVD
jgi:hypothetical protein